MKLYHFLYIFCNFTSKISARCSITYKSLKMNKQESFGSLEVILLIFDDTKKNGRKDDDTILHCALKSYTGGISLNIGYLALTKP